MALKKDPIYFEIPIKKSQRSEEHKDHIVKKQNSEHRKAEASHPPLPFKEQVIKVKV